MKLTYMLMREQIAELIRRKELFLLPSHDWGPDTPRALFVTQEVLDAVTPPFPSSPRGLHAEFRQALDAFLEMGEMSVGLDPLTKPSDALMARVAPVEWEFFDFRITSPKPFIRAFGGFAERDTFVVVSWQYRDVIADKFDEEVLRCKHEWERLFGRTPPFKGTYLDDYLSNAFPV
ncbi:hypothetical protein [Bradyrhizobium liaoningense]|uniref:hypothetical protein n=1 Tax=Bradyrhizobium liaoningense TaxID=43992 RepID=UPI001BA797A4|nr:hypothetical protein [Bradyrhizobium liaoningense]MBR0855631.1 hypothetical protein [Bradyrhizobium liaoningense]